MRIKIKMNNDGAKVGIFIVNFVYSILDFNFIYKKIAQ